MTALYSNGPEFRAPKDILLQYKTSKTLLNKDSKTGFTILRIKKIKDRKNGVAVKIGSTLDNSDVVTWLYMETHESRKPKLQDRIRKGRAICVQGYLREYRKDDSDSPYRAIVANDFSTRKDRPMASKDPASSSSAAGYTEVDPTPEY